MLRLLNSSSVSVRPLGRFLVLLLALCSISFSAFSQEADEEEASNEIESEAEAESYSAASAMLGGLVTAPVSHAIGSFAWFDGRLGYIGEVFSNFTWRNYDDGTTGQYIYVGGAAGIRGSILDGGRGFFLGITLGVGNAWFTVSDATTSETVSGWHVVIAPTVGIRFGNEKGFFGEAAVRGILSFPEILISTESTPPGNARDEQFTYHTWYLAGGEPAAQFYVGIGYTF